MALAWEGRKERVPLLGEMQIQRQRRADEVARGSRLDAPVFQAVATWPIAHRQMMNCGLSLRLPVASDKQ